MFRGEHLSLTVVNEVLHLAYDRGHSHLFLYTRPNNIGFFVGCRFYPIVEAPGLVTLMENTPIGIRRYCDSLKKLRQPGARIGSAVINANPFTRGHRYLIEQAVEACDWLHLFVVAEDASFFPYRDRFQLIKSGVEGIDRLTLHPGSEYMISRATFSSYFFKEKNVVGDCFTAIDLLIFREWIAPALGITHRFVGTEPFCRVTNKYNVDMKYWLQADLSAAPPVKVVEIPRTELDARAISASEVAVCCKRTISTESQSWFRRQPTISCDRNIECRPTVSRRRRSPINGAPKMKIIREAMAGTLESSDVLVKVAPSDGPLEVVVKSEVERQFGAQIRRVVAETLGRFGSLRGRRDR